MNKFNKITKLTSNKYLNMFVAEYDTPNGKMNYEFASRKSEENLALKTLRTDADAVRVVPYFVQNGKVWVVLIEEFRFAVNRFLYGVPAGLVDKGETPSQAMKRELLEEAGAEVISFESTEKPSFTSAGLTDESIACFEAEVKMSKAQELEKTEFITTKIVELAELPDFLDKHEFGLQSRLQLRQFYYKHKIKEYEKEMQ